MQINLSSLGFGHYIERESWRRGALRHAITLYAYLLAVAVAIDALIGKHALQALPYVSAETLSGVAALALAAVTVGLRGQQRAMCAVCAALGGMVILCAVTALTLSVSSRNLGTLGGYALQMPATSAISMLCLGILVLLRNSGKTGWVEGVFNAVLLTCVLTVLAALLTPHSVGGGWLGGANPAPAALYSGVGTLLIGLLAWWQWYFEPVQTDRAANDEHRIVVVAAAVLVVTSLFAGFTVMSVFTRYMEADLQKQLARTFVERGESIQRDIARATEAAQITVSNRPHLRRLLAKMDSTGLTAAERTETEEILNNIARSKGVLAFEIRNSAGEFFGARGSFTRAPRLAIPLHDHQPTTLLWNKRFTLLTLLPMQLPNGKTAHLLIEAQLERLNALNADRAGLGDRGDLWVCNSGTPAHCYSVRHAKPMLFASPVVNVSTKTLSASQTHGEELFVAGPIGKSGLTLVLKVQRADLYQPLRTPMLVAVGIGAALILLGLALMRWQVFPLVTEVVNARRRVHAVIEHSGEGIITFNDAGLIQTCNVAALKMFGYRSDEMLGRFIKALLPDVTFFAQQDLSVLPQDPSEAAPAGAVALNAVRKNGDNFPAEVTVSEIPIDGQRHHVAMVRDNTERQRVQHQLRERYEELQALNRQLREAQNQLLQSEKMASIGQLAAGVAHEINNPIGYVFSNLGTLDKYLGDLMEVIAAYESADALLADHPAGTAITAVKEKVDLPFLREDIGALMNESKEGITRVKKIVHDLKDFSHVHDSDEWQAADLHQCLDSTLNIVCNELKYKAEIVKHYGELPLVECLPSQINQVLMNLLVNAGQAIETRGTITLTTGREGESVWIQVADSGKGIADEHLSRIFDPFFTTKPVGSGTGLGLSLSYGIMQKHHGIIEVVSAPGKGTAFTLRLPVKRETRDTVPAPADALMAEAV